MLGELSEKGPLTVGQSPAASLQAQPVSTAIDYIYSLDEHHLHWLKLAQNLLAWLDECDAPLDSPASIQQQLSACLVPHIERAIRLQCQHKATQTLEGVKNTLLTAHGLAVACVNAQGECLYVNSAMAPYWDALTPAQQKPIVQVPAHEPLLLQGAAGETLCRVATHNAQGERIYLLLLQAYQPVALDEKGLCQAFGLTAAEAAVASGLVQGCAVEAIATAKGTSVETVRTQIKKVMAKLGVHRQSELVARLLGSPAALQWPKTLAVPEEALRYCPVKGAKIAYKELGPSTGFPVFFCTRGPVAICKCLQIHPLYFYTICALLHPIDPAWVIPIPRY